MTADVAGDAASGDATDLGRHLLDNEQQRKAEHEGPGQPVSELGPHLAVRADATGVVIGGAGDQPRPQPAQERVEA